MWFNASLSSCVGSCSTNDATKLYGHSYEAFTSTTEFLLYDVSHAGAHLAGDQLYFRWQSSQNTDTQIRLLNAGKKPYLCSLQSYLHRINKHRPALHEDFTPLLCCALHRMSTLLSLMSPCIPLLHVISFHEAVCLHLPFCKSLFLWLNATNNNSSSSSL